MKDESVKTNTEKLWVDFVDNRCKKDVLGKKLINGDCLEVMKDIPDGSIDAIITDPPYGTTACKWDSVIDFELMWEQLHRIIKPNGAIVLFGSEPFSSALRMSNIKNYKYDWVWNKKTPGGFAHAKNMPLKYIENIMVFSKAKVGHIQQIKNRVPYNPQDLKKVNKIQKNCKRKKEESAFGNRPSHKNEYTQEFTNYPKNILEFSRDKGFHPTQKPVKLIEYLIKTYTQEKESVLDFTSGSGTTAIACLNTGRNYICIEKDETYFKQSEERIKNHKIQGELI